MIGSRWPMLLLGRWCGGRRRPVCPAVGVGGGGTIPRSRAQVWGVFPGGRAHRSAVGIGDEGRGEGGRELACGGRGSLVSFAELAACSGQGRECAAVVLGDSAWTWGGSLGRCAWRRDEANLSSISRHGRLRHRVSSRLDEVFTPTTRAAPLDPGHGPDRHQTTDLAVGGSNPSRRATITAGQRPCARTAAWWQGRRTATKLRPRWRALTTRLRPRATTFAHAGFIAAGQCRRGVTASGRLWTPPASDVNKPASSP
jgi:hypothetical protein